MSPCENTIALGGVATGSMKAKDEDIVAGNIKNSGLIRSPMAWIDGIGVVYL